MNSWLPSSLKGKYSFGLKYTLKSSEQYLSVFRRQVMRAGQHYKRNESGIQTRPFFRAYSRVVGRDDDSDEEDVYANDDVDNFRVYRHSYTWNRDDVVSKWIFIFKPRNSFDRSNGFSALASGISHTS